MQMICKKLVVALVLALMVSVPLTWWSASAETSSAPGGSYGLVVAREGTPVQKHDCGEPDVGDTGRQVATAGVQAWSPDPQLTWWQRLHWNGGVLAPYVCWIPLGADD